ncbi:MAG: cupin domain-containing protein [Marinibacterium sp.]
MPVLDLSTVPHQTGSIYPGRLAEAVAGRTSQKLGDAGGLTQFGANLVHLAAGAKSSLRHYHMEQDEFVMVTAGTCTLIDDDGAHDLQPGDCACFPAGQTNGHHLVNRTDAPAAFLVIGTRTPSETAYYSDVDLMVHMDETGARFSRKDGRPLTPDQIGDTT